MSKSSAKILGSQVESTMKCRASAACTALCLDPRDRARQELQSVASWWQWDKGSGDNVLFPLLCQALDNKLRT